MGVNTGMIFGSADCTCGVWMSVTPPPPCPVHTYVRHQCCCHPPEYSVITTTTSLPPMTVC